MSTSAASDHPASTQEAAELVFQAVHSIWEEWSQRCLGFDLDEANMQSALRERLRASAHTPWSVPKPTDWTVRKQTGLPKQYSAWRGYDVGVFLDADQPIALLEVALKDTNVRHALHNGELKLLGNCSGTGVSSQKPFSTERALTADDAAILERHLKSIPVRGLFFVGSERILNQPERVMWWETKGANFSGETRFWSALLAPEKKTTLRQVFERLAEEGLYCWFYSLCGEESLEYLPAGQ